MLREPYFPRGPTGGQAVFTDVGEPLFAGKSPCVAAREWLWRRVGSNHPAAWQGFDRRRLWIRRAWTLENCVFCVRRAGFFDGVLCEDEAGRHYGMRAEAEIEGFGRGRACAGENAEVDGFFFG